MKIIIITIILILGSMQMAFAKTATKETKFKVLCSIGNLIRNLPVSELNNQIDSLSRSKEIVSVSAPTLSEPATICVTVTYTEK